jgi:hypothetical protein
MILHREQTKKTIKIASPAFKGKKSKGITHIQVPDNKDSTKWENISDLVKIEELLIERKKVHFRQTQHTIFATGQLKDYFNYNGTNQNAEDLIS